MRKKCGCFSIDPSFQCDHQRADEIVLWLDETPAEKAQRRMREENERYISNYRRQQNENRWRDLLVKEMREQRAVSTKMVRLAYSGAAFAAGLPPDLQYVPID